MQSSTFISLRPPKVGKSWRNYSPIAVLILFSQGRYCIKMTKFRLRTWGKWEGYQNLNIMHFHIAMQCWRKLAIPLHSLCLQVDKLSWHHTDHRHLKVWTQGSCIVSVASQWRNQRVLLNFYWWVKSILLFLWHNSPSQVFVNGRTWQSPSCQIGFVWPAPLVTLSSKLELC